MNRMLRLALCLGLAALALSACGGSAETRCCVNGKYYSCPNTANATCDGCTADPSKDSSCKS